MTATHTVSGLFTNPATGKLVRIGPGTKLYSKPGESVEDALRALLGHYPGADTSKLVVKSLVAKPKTKKITLNTQHDYITLTAQYADGVVRITISRSGLKVSGDLGGRIAGNVLLGSIDNLERRGSGMSPSDLMTLLKGLADKAANKEEFVTAVNNNAATVAA